MAGGYSFNNQKVLRWWGAAMRGEPAGGTNDVLL